MKDSTVSARVEYAVKIEAKEILRQLGIPVSVVINSLYRQIIYKNGIPFALTIPTRPKALDEYTKEELDEKLMRGYKEALAGQGEPFEAVFDELERGL
ncbi:type II toxin-antitoxin system RelB/DinJ family antitoxin [Veillonella sp. YH-vei2232]|jgi:DNA-damage-inducible protein J|uniref:Type II toxin-antitoxin system RelB/DinJ family antitoxin n=1 Tax=Veillonella absiana TaxID=3079305 RepID=A0ABU3Z9T5_9FIRM|nr:MULTISPECIES: type II toxin-antitoxin system RelB/DinJ family antitoxin [unclassified Veillonella]MDV5063178.1 type II toxin-antitoxin system RelB/DinJ family antitoxin [Veillonella sp. YH-vei2232]MDV5088654.1 type II toxin-antitoxin system RelB/DinJ family antitoxin [Veillonella sp. YH-vei2233]